MTLYDFANQYGSEPLTKPWQANTQGCIFLLLVLCFTKSTVAEISNYLIKEHLVASVWMRKKMAQVRWWMRWWHYFSSDSESQVHTEQLNLIEAFPCRWIGHGFATPPSPVLWPLCSLMFASDFAVNGGKMLQWFSTFRSSMRRCWMLGMSISEQDSWKCEPSEGTCP